MVLQFLIDDRNGPGITPPLERVPMEDAPKLTPREEIFASAATAKLLQDMGDEEMTVPEDEANIAREIFDTGRDPTEYERQLPGVMLQLEAMLSAYDYDMIADASKIRNYVTNKLLEETEDKDPKVRLKAYEMLGKITEVGLFTEKREISITNRSTTELESLLEDKLDRLLNGSFISQDVQEAEFDDPERESALAKSRTVTVEDVLNDL